MHDDDEYDLRSTIRFEDIDLDEEGSTGPDEWLRVLDGQEIQTMTDPFRPALDLKHTRRMEVPEALLMTSRESSEGQQGWEQHFSVVDHRGFLVVRLKDGQVGPGDHVEILVRKVAHKAE